MSNSDILHIISQYDENFDELTMVNSPISSPETDAVHTTATQIHPFFLKKKIPYPRSKSKTTYVKAHQRKGIFVSAHSRLVKRNKKNKTKVSLKVRLDPQMLVLQHTLNVKEAIADQKHCNK